VGWNLGGVPPRSLSVRPPIPAPSAADLDGHLPALREALVQQRRFRTEQLAGLRALAPAGDPAQEEVTATLRRGAQVALAEIDAALDRMARGRYGSCVRCGRAIPVERLEILPAVAHCMTCQHALTN
jgi:DnaK suppressor protein